MNKNARYILLVICLAVLAAAGCQRAQNEAPNTPENTISIKGNVRELYLYPDPPPPFPEHEGRSEFMSYCAICHSLKYISTQPDFPAKVWKAEVDKMTSKYHAPIDSISSKKIVDYLVAVKSKK